MADKGRAAAGVTAPRNQAESDLAEQATQRLAGALGSQRAINAAAREAQQLSQQRGINILEAVEFVLGTS